jgi:hypothetical protein
VQKQIARREPLSLVLVGRALEDAEMGEREWINSQHETARGSLDSAFWPAETQKGRKTQASQALDGGDEDSMPLLPRSKRRLLDRRTTTGHGDEDDEMPPPTAKRRGGAFVPDTPTQSQTSESKATHHRKTRGESVVSDISSVGGSTRSKRVSAATTGRTARGGRGTQKQPVLLEDSDEEGVEFTPSAIGSASGSGGTRARGRSTRGTQYLAEVDTATTRSSARTTSQMGPPQTSGSASVTMGRKKLLPVDDDDDDMVSRLGGAHAHPPRPPRR